MEGPITKGDREEQDSNKGERNRDVSQNLRNWKKAAAEDTKEETLSQELSVGLTWKLPFSGLKSQMLTMSCDSV